MQNINLPTSWPQTPTSAIASHLRQELHGLKHDVAQLTEKTEAAADRIALVLKRLRSQDEMGRSTSDDAVSHKSDLSETIRIHPFAEFSFHDFALMDIAQDVEVRSDPEGEHCPPPTLGENVAYKRGSARVAKPILPSSPTLTQPGFSCESSSTFLSVTASLKNEIARTHQCEVVERRIRILVKQVKQTTSYHVSSLIARQIIAYMHFLNTDRVRCFIREHLDTIPPTCVGWYSFAGGCVDEALTRCSRVQQVNNPVYDGLVALVFIHFGIFDVDTTSSTSHGSKDEAGGVKLPPFAKLLNKTRTTKTARQDKGSGPAVSHYLKDMERSTRGAALSVETLVAVTELCLQGVLSETVLSDILVLFTLGDVENNFTVVPSDIELLQGFLHEGLLPRKAVIRAKFTSTHLILDLTAIVESMEKFEEVSKAEILRSTRRFTNCSMDSIESEGRDWINLDRMPCTTGTKWSQLSQTKGFLTSARVLRRLCRRDGSATRDKKPANMLDLLNGDTPTS
ncbi:hypothetical protein NDA18_003358 [Ustilago nuda]|nr:hypothetical protein NDA18_003358 [Ustilago nuda]